MSKKSENLPAVQPERPPQLYAPVVQPRQFWASWDVSTPSGRRIMQTMMTVGDLEGEHILGQPLKLHDVAGWPDTLTSPETGEVSQVNYTCLVLSDGHYVRTTSECVRRCVETFIQFHGEPPWDGIPVVLSKRKSRQGQGYYFVLTEIPEPE